MDTLSTSVALFLEPDAELADRDPRPFSVESIRSSKIVATTTHARYGKYEGKTACLVAFRFDFIPAYDVRFKYAEVELKIVRGGASHIIAYRPHKWDGRASILSVLQSSKADGRPEGSGSSGGSGGSGNAPNGAAAGEGYKAESECVKREEVRRARVLSVFEGSLVTWYLNENDVTREELPQPFKTAVIVETDGVFSIRVTYKTRLWSSDPASWQAAHARFTNPLDLSRPAVGDGRGPEIQCINEMEKRELDLDHLVAADWDL